MVRRPAVIRCLHRRHHSQCSKIFFSETTLPIKAKFYVEPPWIGRTIFYSRHLGHMTKVASMPMNLSGIPCRLNCDLQCVMTVLDFISDNFDISKNSE